MDCAIVRFDANTTEFACDNRSHCRLHLKKKNSYVWLWSRFPVRKIIIVIVHISFQSLKEKSTSLPFDPSRAGHILFPTENID